MLVLKLSQLTSADDVVINTVDPGFSGTTSLARDAHGMFGFGIVMGAMHAVMGRTAEKGAWTYVDAAVTRGKESHGSFIANWEHYPFHAMMYTEEGKRTMQQLWDETLMEQQAFGVREALAAMTGRQ